MHEDNIHLLTGQMMLGNNYKDPNMLPEVNKDDMGGTLKNISDHIVVLLEFLLHCYQEDPMSRLMVIIESMLLLMMI